MKLDPTLTAVGGADITVAEINDERRRYRNEKIGATMVQVTQGDYYVTGARDELLSTVLGSCIPACIRAPRLGVGGMNHFLLPSDESSDESFASLRYGSFAMEQLINSLMVLGARREDLEVKIFGGANVIRSLAGVGHRNADFIEDYLAKEGLRVSAKHLRGHFARKLIYFPKTGKVKMKELSEEFGSLVQKRELKKKVHMTVQDDSIELFD